MSSSRSRTTTETAKSSARRGAEPPIAPDSTEWSSGHSVANAPSLFDVAQADARRAIGRFTEISTTPDVSATESQSSATLPETRSSDSAGSELTDSESATGSQTSLNSDGPSKSSTRHWRQPKNAKDWAAQINAIATAVLNHEIDLEEARLVSALSRSAAQLLTAEVQRARFLQIEPDLNLEFADEPQKAR